MQIEDLRVQPEISNPGSNAALTNAASDAWSSKSAAFSNKRSESAANVSELQMTPLDYGSANAVDGSDMKPLGGQDSVVAWDWLHMSKPVDTAQEKFNAAIFEMAQILKKPDHIDHRVEYSAMVGSSFFQGVGVSGIYQSLVDVDETSAAASRGERYALDGRIPDSYIHSHPRLFEKGQERPWQYFSPTDVANLKFMKELYGHEVTGYILGPDGTVMKWSPGDKVKKNSQGEWGEPVTIGRFDEKGNYTPIHMQNGKRIYEHDKTIPAGTIQKWNKDNHWGADTVRAEA